MMKVTIFGTGYVGLVTGVCLAELGHHVLCVDVDEQKIQTLRQGKPTLYEEGLKALLQKHLSNQHLEFTTSPQQAVEHGIIQMIAVGTPPQPNGAADLTQVITVAKTIAQEMKEYRLIITKSTVPVGTAKKIESEVFKILNQREIKIDFDTASNPEFLREGCAIEDFMHPDRIVVGCRNDRALKILQELYEPLTKKNHIFVSMTPESAELTKYAANSFLATKISFINEISQIAEKAGANIQDIQLGIGLDHRIGRQFLNAGCGYGGSCFPKDILALKTLATELNIDPYILNAVLKRNLAQQQHLFDKIKHYFNNNLENKTIGLWGLAFKPNTDDIRSATSLELIKLLNNAGSFVQAYDPMAMPNIQKTIQSDRLKLEPSKEKAINNADALVIVTEWDEFKNPNFDMIKSHLKQPVIFDGRNLFDIKKLKTLGFDYISIGR